MKDDLRSSVSEEDSSTETDQSYQTTVTSNGKTSSQEDLPSCSCLQVDPQRNGTSDSSSGEEITKICKHKMVRNSEEVTVDKTPCMTKEEDSITCISKMSDHLENTSTGRFILERPLLGEDKVSKCTRKGESMAAVVPQKPINQNAQNNSGSLKAKFLALLGQKPKPNPVPRIKRSKDQAYQNLLNQIMIQESLNFSNRPVLEHSLSAPEVDGFAVREFPQSSQPRFTKHISLDNETTSDIPFSSQKNQKSLSTEDTSISNKKDTQAENNGANNEFSSILLKSGVQCGTTDSQNCNISHNCMNSTFSEELPPKGNKTFPGQNCGVAQLKKTENQITFTLCHDENATGAHGTNLEGANMMKCENGPKKTAKSPIHKFTRSQSESDNESWKQVTAQAIEKLENEISNLTFPEYPRRCLRHKKKLNRNTYGVSKRNPDFSNSFSSEDGSSDVECQCEGQCYMPEHWESSNGESTNGEFEASNGNHYQEMSDNSTFSMSENKEGSNNSMFLMSKKDTNTSSESEKSDNTCMRFYHVFKEGELVHLIDKYVDTLEVVESCYDHANWCVVAEKCDVWTI